MGVTSGKGRLLPGSPADRIKRQNLTEFRGTIWEAVNDWFFGVSTVDYDWNDANDAGRVTRWIYTQDGASVSAATVDVPRRRLDVGLTTGADNGSNQRELWTIPETAAWGVSHALTEIKAEAYGQVAGVNVKPQHGLGLQAQEDTERRAVLVWHDVVVGNPHVINVGVWQGNLDGSGFVNRGGNVIFDLGQRYTLSAGSRTGGVVTCTSTSHGMFADEYLDITWTREFSGTSMTRSANVVTATVGSGHLFEAGDAISVGLSSPGSFDGSFTITSVTGTTILWSQTGANESGTGTVKDKSSDVTQVKPTIVDANTIQYPDARHDKSSLGTATDGAFRKFPYFMEVRVAGTIVWTRCWDRSQPKPDWVQPGHAFIVDLDKANRAYTVTASSRASNVSTLTIGAHDVIPGNLIDVSGIADGSFNNGNAFVTAVGATTVSYPNTGPDTASGGSGTCVREGGSFDEAGLASISTPRGSGRVAVVSSHAGLLPHAHTSYGDVVGANSFDITLQPTLQVTELETARSLGRTKVAPVGQVSELETTTVVGGAKVELLTQVAEVETATVTAPTKLRVVPQAVETETATVAVGVKVRSAAAVVETELAVSISRPLTMQVVVEVETAITTTGAKLREVTQATEVEVAAATGGSKIRPAAQVVETETAGLLTPTRQLTAQSVTEIETADAVGGTKVRSPAQVIEAETAVVVGRSKLLSTNQVTELEIATVATPVHVGPVAQVLELETAAVLTGAKSRVLTPSIETETTQVVMLAGAVDATPPVQLEVTYGGATTVTSCGWIRPDVVPPADPGYQTFWFMDNLSWGAWTVLRTVRLTSTTMRVELVQDGTTAIIGPDVDAGEWWFLALTRTGNDLELLWRAQGQGSLGSDTGLVQGNFAVAALILLGERTWAGVSTLEGAGANWRLFETVLSSAEILTESASEVAVATEWGDWPLTTPDTATEDISGSNRDTTFTGGSLVGTPGPDISLPVADLGQPIELETAQAVTAAKAVTAAQATETEMATAWVRVTQRSVVQALEAETASTVVGSKVDELGQLVEVETASPLGSAKSGVVTQTSEVETANAILGAHGQSVGAVLETETAGVVGRAKIATVPQVTEVETAIAVTGAKSLVAAQVIETESSQVVIGAKAGVAAQVLETEVAVSIEHPGVLTQVIELELAMGLAQQLTVGQSTELETAGVITRLTGVVLGQVTELEDAQATTGRKTQLAGQVIEIELAQWVRPHGHLLTATEQEQAPGVTGVKRHLVDLSLEAETAFPVGASKDATLTAAQELELALVLLPGGELPTDYLPASVRTRTGRVVLRERRGISLREGGHITVVEGP